MPSNTNICGLALDIIKTDLAAGKQGKVHLASLSADPNTLLIVKEMENNPAIWSRTQLLTSASVPALSTGLSGPFACELGSDGLIRHVAPYIEGDHLENTPATGLPQNLEMALELVTNADILEEHGLCQGDIAESNVMFGSDGSVSFIDCDGFASIDPNAPPPLTLGQHHMLAPELRTGAALHPNQLTDRFALAVFLNTLILGRHTVQGLAGTPAEVDTEMSRGIWPERNRFLDPDEVPIEALGEVLQDLFDRAFLLDPNMRPSPQEWCRGLIHALDNCWIHDCGSAFVANKNTTQCPYCQQAIIVPNQTPKLYVNVENGLARCSAKLIDHQTITLGRETLPNMAQTVSARHLDITPIGEQLYLRHRGTNPTFIEQNGQWHQLSDHWLDIASFGQIKMMLAETEISLQVMGRRTN